MSEEVSAIEVGLQYLDKAERFGTSKKGKKMYDELKAGKEKFHPFETQTQIFVLALALGLVTREKLDGKFDEKIIRWETYTTHDPFGVFPLIVKSLHPDLDQSGVARMMEKYAEAGLTMLHEEFKKNDSIDFAKIQRLSKAK